VSFKEGTAKFDTQFAVFGHKTASDTKSRQLQDARDSGPLLVRELEESKYEVVAGARRLRAAKLAELEKLPVRVVKLTDAEAIEAQCVELSVVGKIFLC
jgi:ParB family chromosome partitioning protein